jgi:hypothetical protein
MCVSDEYEAAVLIQKLNTRLRVSTLAAILNGMLYINVYSLCVYIQGVSIRFERFKFGVFYLLIFKIKNNLTQVL